MSRQWQMLSLLPKEPDSISARGLCTALAARGFRVTKRTVERDLDRLAATFPVSHAAAGRKYLWSWGGGDSPRLMNERAGRQALIAYLASPYLREILPDDLFASLEDCLAEAEKMLDSLEPDSWERTLLRRFEVRRSHADDNEGFRRDRIRDVLMHSLTARKPIRIRYWKEGAGPDVEAIEGVGEVRAIVLAPGGAEVRFAFDGRDSVEVLKMQRIKRVAFPRDIKA